jgi:hypothetical protein
VLQECYKGVTVDNVELAALGLLGKLRRAEEGRQVRARKEQRRGEESRGGQTDEGKKCVEEGRAEEGKKRAEESRYVRARREQRRAEEKP